MVILLKRADKAFILLSNSVTMGVREPCKGWVGQMAEDQSDDIDNEEELEEGAEGEASEGGFDKKKIIIIVAGVILLLGAIGGGLFFTGILGGSDPATAEEAHGDDNAHGSDKDDGHGAKKEDSHGDKGGDDHGEGGTSGAFLPIPTMNITLNSENGTPRYLRLSVQLELKDPADQEAVQAVMPRVIDKFQTYLRELRVKDLKGSGGIYRLQMELLWRVNQAAAPIEVKDVLFQEILIQ